MKIKKKARLLSRTKARLQQHAAVEAILVVEECEAEDVVLDEEDILHGVDAVVVSYQEEHRWLQDQVD